MFAISDSEDEDDDDEDDDVDEEDDSEEEVKAPPAKQAKFDKNAKQNGLTNGKVSKKENEQKQKQKNQKQEKPVSVCSTSIHSSDIISTIEI